MTQFLRHITRQNGCDMTTNKSARHNRIGEYGTRIVLFILVITIIQLTMIWNHHNKEKN